MNLSEFKRSLAKAKPPSGLAPALSALWWAGKDEWEKAHTLVMAESGKDCAWVHAHLHRVEGDLQRPLLVRPGGAAGPNQAACRRMGCNRGDASRR